MLGTLVACVIYLTRVTDNGRVRVEQSVFDQRPPPGALRQPEPAPIGA